MTPVLPTPSERLAALQAFGYTEREAAFLSTAALHGGYFLRRQYCCAIGTQSGGNAAALIDRTPYFEACVGRRRLQQHQALPSVLPAVLRGARGGR